MHLAVAAQAKAGRAKQGKAGKAPSSAGMPLDLGEEELAFEEVRRGGRRTVLAHTPFVSGTQAVEGMAAALGKVRAGHASGGMLDAVQVPMDGSEVPLAAVAQVMVKDPQTLLLTVYDPAMVRTPQPRPMGGWCRRVTEGAAAPQASAVDRAIREAGLGLSPALDGSKLRVGLPRCAPDVRAGHPHKGITRAAA